MKCEFCGKEFNRRYAKKYCSQECYKKANRIYKRLYYRNLSDKNKKEYIRKVKKRAKNSAKNYPDGKIKCPFCGKYYKRICSHTRQKHNISAKEYKEIFGLPKRRGVISRDSYRKSKKAVTSAVIRKNLIKKGKKTRFNNK